MALPCNISRYGLFFVLNTGRESSSGEVAPSFPNHERFCSLRIWKNVASSSSYITRASEGSPTASNECARDSYMAISITSRLTSDVKSDLKGLTLSKNHVQKFHPTIIRCASPRLTSSSRSTIAVSNAKTILSLILLITSGHAAGSSLPSGGRLTCTHLTLSAYNPVGPRIRRACRSLLPVLKSDFNLPNIPLSRPKTSLPVAATDVGGLTSTINGVVADLLDARSDSQSRMKDLVEFLYVSESYPISLLHTC